MKESLENDLALAARAGKGDTEAFRILVNRHSRSVFAQAYRMCLNESDADDIVQESFLRVWKQIGKFDGRANFSTWLYRISANCAIDVLRSRKRWVLDEETAKSGSDYSPTPERHALSGELGENIESAMKCLTVGERTAFVMRHMEGFSLEEIANTLDCNAGAAKHAVFRAVQKMRGALRAAGLQPAGEGV